VSEYEVVVGAGSLRSDSAEVVVLPHRWTPGGVTVEASFTGAHLLHLAVAGCVLNDVYREAHELAIPVDGVRVTASGDFDTAVWASTGIDYAVEVDARATPGEIDALLRRVDEVAEIPRAVRAGAAVGRRRPG